ncbi:MAG TPA: TetR/AcrR family transcriptional regulator [Terracidiphilus sp.]|nr:TetR/AcrR family transcriptional regulator [Terracidiphilus sp.]
MTALAPSRTQAERADQTRARILEAALTAFSSKGLAGARTEQIAEAAGVNKALLYYYFESKEKLYEAALEMAATKVRDRSMAVFSLNASAGERVLRIALDHFDRILSQGEFQSLLQQEMVRAHKGEAGAMSTIMERVFAPIQAMYQSMIREAISSGELIDVDWLQIHLASLGANVFYFLAAPVWRMLLPFDPFDPAVLAERRKAVVQFLGLALFMDRVHGAQLAARVLADMPMPEVNMPKELNLYGRKE